MPRPAGTTIVVLAWNSAETLEQCLRSALDQGVDQVLVLDNGSSDGSVAVAQGLGGVEVIRSPVNLGFSGGQVAALPHCRGEFLLLLNADAALLPGAAAAMLELMSDERVAVVGCRALPWDEHDPSPPVEHLLVHPVTAHTRPAQHAPEGRDVSCVSGAAVLIRRSALESVGGFEPRFFAYYEETDLFARLKRAGYRVVVQPRAQVRHRVAASLGEGSPAYLRLMTRNRYFFAVRNFDAAFLRVFLRRYLLEEGRAAVLGWRSPSGRGRSWGALTAVLRTPALLRERSRVLGAGGYNDQVIREAPPEVSVVIANYNHGSTVLAAVQSARNQTLPPREVIVVDDGSTDDSLSLVRAAEEHGECRVLAMSNTGVVGARNTGANQATGDWLVFLDADDQLEPTYLEECWKAVLRSRGRIGVVTTGSLRVRGREVVTVVPPRHRLARLAAGNYLHCASLLRREAFEEAGGYSSQMVEGYEDWDLFLSVAERGWRVLRVRRPLLRYHLHDASRNVGAAERERHLRAVLRARHPAVFGPPRSALSTEVAVRTWIARVRAVLREVLRADGAALHARWQSRRAPTG